MTDVDEVVNVVSQDEIKKQYRNVIFIEDGDGNLVKYVRAQPVEKPKRNQKPKYGAKCDAKQVPAVVTPPSSLPVALKSFEIQQAEMVKCSVNVHRLSDDDIAVEVEKLKHNDINGGVIALVAESLDSNRITKQSDGVLVIRLPKMNGNETIVISEPLWRNCFANPLNTPMFELGEKWLLDLQPDGSLVFHLPEINGKSEKFVFSEEIWRAWFGSYIDFNSQSIDESQPIQEQHNGENFSNNNSLALIDTSEFARLLGANDDEILAALFEKNWYSDSQDEVKISMENSMAIDSIINDQSTLSMSERNEDGYDASIEVRWSQGFFSSKNHVYVIFSVI